jgi:hypothetical protein
MCVRIDTGSTFTPRLKMSTAVLALTSKPPKFEQGNVYLPQFKLNMFVLKCNTRKSWMITREVPAIKLFTIISYPK